MKKIISLLLSVFLVLPTIVPLEAIAETNDPTLTVQSVSDSAGEIVDVPITIENNPGILGATIQFTYDTGLTLVDAVAGDAFSTLTMTKPGKYVSPCRFTWDGLEMYPEDIKDGTVLTLRFKIADDAENGSEYRIRMAYEEDGIVDGDLNSVDLALVNGTVTVRDYVPGDVNGDEKVNSTDTIMLRRFLAGGYGVTINETAADINVDGKINSADTILIRRFIAGGYPPIPTPTVKPKPTCDHNMTATEAKAPTCTVDGNIAYWHCEVCDKYFTDEEGTTEIGKDYLSVKANGHTVVVDDAVAATYDSTGLTEGKHCSVCNEIIIEQQVIPVLQKDEYSITYHISDNDTYLMSLGIENPNPSVYTKQDGLVLKNITIPGYSFKGWFTLQTGGTQVTEIKPGETGDKELYAQWERMTYSIQYESDLVPITSEKYSEYQSYTTGVEKTLPKPSLDKYTFVGWSDENGKLLDRIPAGTVGDIVLYANWASNRNKAEPVTKLQDPVICEDTENGLILFTYEIGKIVNVPLYTTLDLVCANGIITTKETTETENISETNAKTVAESITNATTNSLSWTLSKNWLDTTEVSQRYIEEKGITREKAEMLAKTSTGTYSLTKSNGGSSSDVKTSNSTYKISANDEHYRENSDEYDRGSELTTDVSAEVSASVSAGYGPVSATVGTKLSAEETDKETENIKATNSGTDYWANSSEYTGSDSMVSTNSKTWSSASSYSKSDSTSQSQTISEAVSELVSEQWGYGSTYSNGGENQEAQAFATTDSKNEESSSTVTYFDSHINTTTKSFTSTGNTEGNYRMVMAGTMHVFAVVGYDVASSEYFVYTYSVLGDGTKNDGVKEYLDYSKNSTSFDDYEASVLPFEVPSFVNDYVNSRIAKTNGLVIDPDTGIIVSYNKNNTDKVVVIPSYTSVDNHDGTFSSIKVTGIKEGVFKDNNNIEVVKMGSFIEEIPDSTFEGCSSLKYVICPGVTQIGNNAFSGCTSLEKFTISNDITEVGENAFEGVPEIKASAANAQIAQNIATSNARNIVLDISTIPGNEAIDLALEVGEADSFELQGKDREYKGLSVKSDAAKTVINGITFTENKKIPMELSSESVTLDRVTVDCNGYALVLKADETNVLLNRKVNLISESGNAVVSRNISFDSLSEDVLGNINITGNMLVCGTVNDNEKLSFTNGEIIYITDEEYENYLTSHYIYFDVNGEGGSVGEESKLAALNMPVGELPKPHRDYYSFTGWYTEPDEGEEVTSDTIMTSLNDITVYAHWIENDLSQWTPIEEVPEDAEIVDEKWTYTLTSYTTSNSSTLSGWEKYDTTWAWGDYGSWSSWSRTNPGSSDSRESQSDTQSEWIDTSHYEDRWYYFHYCKTYSTDIWTYAKSGYTHHEINLPYEMSIVRYGSSGTAPEYGNYSCGSGVSPYWFRGGYGGDTHAYYNQEWVSSGYTNNYTVWRYRDRSKVYTYYYMKSEEGKEASEYPEGENISDIQEYVQYRMK